MDILIPKSTSSTLLKELLIHQEMSIDGYIIKFDLTDDGMLIASKDGFVVIPAEALPAFFRCFKETIAAFASHKRNKPDDN